MSFTTALVLPLVTIPVRVVTATPAGLRVYRTDFTPEREITATLKPSEREQLSAEAHARAAREETTDVDV